MRIARVWLGAIVAATLLMGCDGGDGGDKPNGGKDVEQGGPEVLVADDVTTAPDEQAVEPDLVGPGEDLVVPPEEDVGQPGEDVVEPKEDLTQPEPDVTVPEEDLGQPEEDIVELPPEDVVASKGACDNPGDTAVFEGTPDLSDKVSKCVMSCIMNADVAGCSTTCIQDATGLSGGCAQCFGGVVDCTVKNCMLKCMDPNSAACAECRATNCGPAFEECAGVPMT